MKRFYCVCGQEIFFDNLFCGTCGHLLGFEPESQDLLTLIPSDVAWQPVASPQKSFLLCEHREHELQCNWLLPADQARTQCISCSMTRTIPVLSSSLNWRRWRTLEASKRRMLYGLLSLKLPQLSRQGLVFDFLEDKRSNPSVLSEHVLSGHGQGVITINAAEADASYLEATKEAMNEPYRTLLGHFRHEVGHYYWDMLVKTSPHHLEAFRQLFGDEQRDYRRSLDEYYVNGPEADWQVNYISPYACAHPLEDWAETWAHYLLMMETLETALSYSLIAKMEEDRSFVGWLREWMQLVVVMNALSRSTGNTDAYPFVISPSVERKLEFIHDLLH
jgi:hypothetical protein